MRPSALPHSGPLRLDCRQLAPTAVVRRIEDLLKRIRGGPRMLHVIADADMAEPLVTWARIGGARTEVRSRLDDVDVFVYLLPFEFDGHPFIAWRPRVPSAPPGLDATPEGVHVTVGA